MLFSFSLQICLSQLDQIYHMKVNVYVLFKTAVLQERYFSLCRNGIVKSKHLHPGSSPCCVSLLLNIPLRIPDGSAGKTKCKFTGTLPKARIFITEKSLYSPNVYLMAKINAYIQIPFSSQTMPISINMWPHWVTVFPISLPNLYNKNMDN